MQLDHGPEIGGGEVGQAPEVAELGDEATHKHPRGHGVMLVVQCAFVLAEAVAEV